MKKNYFRQGKFLPCIFVSYAILIIVLFCCAGILEAQDDESEMFDIASYLGIDLLKEEVTLPIVFSRIVRASLGEIIEIPFRGTGWEFLGEIASRKGITLDFRRLDTEGQSFIFKTEATGIFILKFFRKDSIRDFILNDHVQVIISQAPEIAQHGLSKNPSESNRIIAEPRWPTSLEEARLLRQSQFSPQTDLSAQTQEPSNNLTNNDKSLDNASTAVNTETTQKTSGTVTQEKPPATATAAATVQEKPPVSLTAETAQNPAETNTEEKPSENQIGITPMQERQYVDRTEIASLQEKQYIDRTQAETAEKNTASVNTQGVNGTDQESSLPESQKTGGIDLENKQNQADLLKKAREEFEAGRFESAISQLDQYREILPSGSDEAWWLYGQCYEAASPGRNMLSALNYYRRLTDDFPQSDYLSDAQKRILYIERFYIKNP